MIKALRIKNFQLIEDVEINFHSGLNVLYGESGSGKSLILKALNSLFGKTSPAVIREGKDKCIIECEFEGVGTFQKVIKRSSTIQSIDGENYTLNAMIEKVKGLLINHHQGDQEQIYDESFQMKIIDQYVDRQELDKLAELKSSYFDQIQKFIRLENGLYNLKQLKQYYESIVSQYEDLNIEDDEDVKLESFISKYENGFQIKSWLDEQDKLIRLAYESLSKAFHLSDKLKMKGFDQKIDGEILNQLDASVKYISNQGYDFESYTEEDLNSANQRLYELNQLKRRFTVKNLSEAKEKYESAKESLGKILNSDDLRNKSFELLNSKKEDYFNQFKLVHLLRIQACERVKNKIELILPDLGFAFVDLDVAINSIEKFQEKNYSYYEEEIRFEISFNKGFKRKPMNKIVSGGEASRLSLAIMIMSKIFNNSVFVLDEVDTGLSKNSLLSMISALKSVRNQIICISHSEEMIQNADNKIKVYKEVVDNMTYTKVKNNVV